MTSGDKYRFTSEGLEREQAFETWRNVMSQVFTVRPNPLVKQLPRGDLNCTLFDDVLASQLAFNAQRMTRGEKMIANTPDHLTFQYYHSGGFAGEIAGLQVAIRRGLVIVTDMRYSIDVRAIASNTAGLSIPRKHVFGSASPSILPVLDAQRNRLLGAKIVSLHRELNARTATPKRSSASEIISFVRRILDPSKAVDVLDCLELGSGIRAMAEDLIEIQLRSRELTPSYIAQKIGVSRATLYRAFEPEGVMSHVRRRRLGAVNERLRDVAERRSLTQIAEDYGFTSLTNLGRAYQSQFGQSPRDVRSEARKTKRSETFSEIDTHARWWQRLGTS